MSAGKVNKSLRIGFACALIAFSHSLFAVEPKRHAVNPAELAALIDRADKVVVDASPGPEPERLYSSSDRKDLSELKTAISIEPPEGTFHCLCIPFMGIQLLWKKEKLGTILVYPNGITIGFTYWSSDARILDKEKWLHWFDARNMEGPRKAVEEDEELDKQTRANEARWVAAMPASLRPVWSKFIAATFPGQPIDTKSLDQELIKEFPDSNRRVRALMSWFGSGAGPWSGFPSYESVPEEMLLEYPTLELLAAIQDQSMTEIEQEGAARLFAGWYFNQRRPEDNQLIPADLKRTLLEHSLKSTDEDKLSRARHAFQQK
jgi:hypothetical protein